MAGDSSAKRSRDANDDATMSECPAKRVNIDEFDNIVTVLVGKEEKRFILHQEAVCAKSKFFKAACSKQWLEGQEKTVRLPEGDAVAFKAYCAWIYSGHIAENTCTQTSTESDKCDEQRALINLYLLGDTVDDIKLRNQATLMTLQSMETTDSILSTQTTTKLWEFTPPGSLIRKMLVDVVVARLCPEDFAKCISHYPQDFVQAVAIASMKAAPMTPWPTMTGKLTQYTEPEKPE